MAAVGKSGLLDGLRFRQQQKSADREGGGGEEFRSLVSASMLGTVDVEGGRSRVATEEEGRMAKVSPPPPPSPRWPPSSFSLSSGGGRGEGRDPRRKRRESCSAAASWERRRKREREREIVAADEDDE